MRLELAFVPPLHRSSSLGYAWSHTADVRLALRPKPPEAFHVGQQAMRWAAMRREVMRHVVGGGQCEES